MKAVIMAGGEGTRLRPLTSNQPKPMLTMANRPMMEHVVMLLRRHDITDIVVTVAFMANTIRTYFGDGSELGVRIVYATEETPLGTAGSVANARDELNEPFVVISGDVLTDIDLSAVIAFHEEKNAIATIALHAVENPLELGIVITREDHSIERFLEKPSWGEVFSDTINTGIYVLDPSIFDFIPTGGAVDFSSDVFPVVLQSGSPIYGCPTSGYWEDVGTIEAYHQAHHDCMAGNVEVEIGGFELRPGVFLGKGAQLDPDAIVEGPAIIGDNATIGPGVLLGEFSAIGNNVQIAESAEVRRSVIHADAFVGTGVHIDGAIIGAGTELRHGSVIDEGAVVGSHCIIGSGAEVRPNVKIYPGKIVESGATVNSSIVFESRGSRALFGRDGIKGLANVDMSPELVLRLTMAWASTFDRGARIITSRDTSRAARMLKRAAMAGANAVGVSVGDLEVATVPVTRHEVRTSGAAGGLTVRLAPDDPESVVIRFFDAEGRDVSEAVQRKVERLYHREEFRRVRASDIGDIEFPSRSIERYTADLIGALSRPDDGVPLLKLVLDVSHGSASFVMPNLLAKLGADVLVVNPFANTPGASSADQDKSARRVADLVRASGSDLGAVIDPDGEHLTIIDDAGHVLTNDESLLLLVSLVVARKRKARVVLPVAVGRGAEAICAAADAQVVWSKLSSAYLMEAAATEEIDFAASQSGAFIFPAFMPAYDAAATLVELVTMVAATGVSCSQLVAGLPATHVSHRAVRTPAEQKGLVMRTVMEDMADGEVILVDGVKISTPTGWVLVLPDPEDPLTHVWAEADSDNEANVQVGDFAARIEAVVASSGSSSSD